MVEYVIVESKSKKDRVDMVFTKRNGLYSGTDVIKYPFKIIRNELGIKARFYDLRGSFATTSLRNGCEIKDIAEPKDARYQGVDKDKMEHLPKGYVWSDYGTLNMLTQVNNCLNIQLRNLLSLLDF